MRGWDFLLPRYPSWILTHHMWIWDQPFQHLHPSYQYGRMWFLYSVVVRLPFKSISASSEWWLSYNLVVIFDLVVRGGELCLPMPPSWLEVLDTDCFLNCYKLLVQKSGNFDLNYIKKQMHSTVYYLNTIMFLSETVPYSKSCWYAFGHFGHIGMILA